MGTGSNGQEKGRADGENEGSELSKDQIAEIVDDFMRSPEEFGLGDTLWSPELVEAHITNKFGAKYAVRGRKQVFKATGLDAMFERMNARAKAFIPGWGESD